MKGFVIAGTSTGVGKTTITAALLAALRARGLAVQPFKCGPDYIDPAHHAAIAGRPSYNLDTWMMSAETNRSIFWTAAQKADVTVVEGVMGLFDGASGKTDEGSTAEIAKLLSLPVVLIVDASNAARSVAALIKGFCDFDPQLRILGVILNGAAGPAHFNLLRDAISSVSVPLLGSFPNVPEAVLAERHLGLITAGEKTWSAEQAAALVDAARKHIDLDLLLANCNINAKAAPAIVQAARNDDPVRIGVARDQAFSFYYQSSLDALKAAGAELVNISPLTDASLPASLDGLYFGGGYPEVFADQLADNRPFLQSLREFVASGRPLYAECGGLMYLAETLTTLDGRTHAMASVLPIAVEMLNHLEAFGYTEVELLADCLVGARGARLRGHSFHYSRITRTGDVAKRYRANQLLTGVNYDEGYCTGNVLASYIHLSFAASPEAAARFVQNCRQAKAVAQ
ncbi:MAG TPA: cobyrinate a,c-diamide synthase [Terriglobales bacterium]|nr:cobyrinate a,c-diamide synthase [Terriglobales bacterium]